MPRRTSDAIFNKVGQGDSRVGTGRTAEGGTGTNTTNNLASGSFEYLLVPYSQRVCLGKAVSTAKLHQVQGIVAQRRRVDEKSNQKYKLQM